ncbi:MULTISPECIES: DNA polymerase IV [Caproicibacterium]|uniref:DNA polymerase IV n=1 Tax=Caproicibacterium argilliputei TaxID=3030016 RepID=A0AA97H401_9FIRM|nr:DNA polymerase IV [Caproicibacterium argilliputei]WOC32868.1 DNA polymerase IV [Caproicibacterium argilliputei]
MERVILHSDCNCFYASVECLYHPELRNKPVAVGGDVEHRHGIILTKNYIAKKYGVKTGEALWQAKQKCPDLVILPPNYPRYLRFSQMARKIYLDYTDQVEPFGLDECWLDVTGSSRKGAGMAIAQEISGRIKAELGITVSIGVSYNKIFAKLGSDYKKPDAITRIGRDNFKEIAWPLDAGDLLYVGHAMQRKLTAYGVHTIGDIASTPEYLLKSWFGKWGSVLYCFANGHDISPVAKYDDTVAIKSIGNSTTTPRDLTCDEDAKIILYVLADSVARRLRQQGLKGRVVGISVRDNGLCSFTRQHKLQNYTSITKEIAQAGLELFRQNYHWQQPVRSLGINISDLTGDSVSTQTDLFSDETQRERKEDLDRATDWLKRRFGTHVVQPAILLKDQRLSGLDPIHDNTIHPVGYF